MNSKVTVIVKATNDIPGFKTNNAWDAFSAEEKLLCTDMVTKLCRQTANKTRPSIKVHNVRICQKVTATAVRQAAKQGKTTGKSTSKDDQLYLGMVVAWQPVEVKDPIDIGDFKAVVQGFIGGRLIDTRVDSGSEPILPVDTGTLPSLDPLISLDTSRNQDEENEPPSYDLYSSQ